MTTENNIDNKITEPVEKLIETADTRLGQILFGGFLVIVGGAFLLASLFNVHIGAYLWPFFMIIPGLFLVAYAMTNEANGEPSVIIGSILTAVGTLLFFQTIFGFWASWSYMWALVAPTAIGIGLWLWGIRFDRDESIKSGKDLTKIGLILFVVFGVFFELLIGISGFGLGRFFWPLLIIGIGLWVLVQNFRPSWR